MPRGISFNCHQKYMFQVKKMLRGSWQLQSSGPVSWERAVIAHSFQERKVGHSTLSSRSVISENLSGRGILDLIQTLFWRRELKRELSLPPAVGTEESRRGREGTVSDLAGLSGAGEGQAGLQVYSPELAAPAPFPARAKGGLGLTAGGWVLLGPWPRCLRCAKQTEISPITAKDNSVGTRCCFQQ